MCSGIQAGTSKMAQKEESHHLKMNQKGRT